MKKRLVLVIFSFVLLAVLGCAGMRPTVFIHPEFDFNYIQKIAVVPFENLSKDQGAAQRVTRIFVVELLSTKSFDVIEPGEVSKALEKYSVVRTADFTQEQMIQIGKQLQVQGLIFGSVSESSASTGGSSGNNIVTLVARLVETEKGMTVWSSTHTESGRGFWSSLLGTGEKSQSEVSRNCVTRVIRTLVK